MSDRAGRITIKIRIKTPPVVQPKAQKRLEKIGAPKSLAVSDAALLIRPIVIAGDPARVGIAQANETKETLNIERQLAPGVDQGGVASMAAGPLTVSAGG